MHRTASLNEISGRYSVLKDEFYIPDLERIQKQSKDNKQGSGEPLPRDEAAYCQGQYLGSSEGAYKVYEGLLNKGVARELARINLPVSVYTEMYWKMDLHNLLHFLKLRLDSHAQYEIRVYAEAIAEIVEAICPIAYEAFEEHILYAQTFSRTEMNALIHAIDPSKLAELAEIEGITKKRKREFLAKLDKKRVAYPTLTDYHLSVANTLAEEDDEFKLLLSDYYITKDKVLARLVKEHVTEALKGHVVNFEQTTSKYISKDGKPVIGIKAHLTPVVDKKVE